MICIIGAIKEELTGIIQHLTVQKKYLHGAATFYECNFKNENIIIVRSGVGQSLANKAALDVIKMYPLRSIISIGFAGGVASELKTSDLILSNNVFYCDNEESLLRFNKVPLSKISTIYNYGEKIKNILTENEIKYTFGNILSLNQVVGTVEFKEWLGMNYPVLGVEMETASIAKTAEQQKVPFISIRSISDDVSHSIIQINKMTNKKGNINTLGIGYYLATHPSQIPSAIELKKNASKAAKALTSTILKLINSEKFVDGFAP